MLKSCYRKNGVNSIIEQFLRENSDILPQY